MLQSGYWLAEFISISHILRKAPAQYGRAYLLSESDGGDTTYFLIHQLATIRKLVARTFLAPDVQEDLLQGGKDVEQLNIHRLLLVARLRNWREQRAIWNSLVVLSSHG